MAREFGTSCSRPGLLAGARERGYERRRPGDTELHTAVREQLEAFPALVLGGDLNLDWTKPEETALLEKLIADLGLVDSGSRPSSPWDRIDYLFLRESEGVALEVIDAGMTDEFVAEGEPLSDHPALYVHLRVTARSP